MSEWAGGVTDTPCNQTAAVQEGNPQITVCQRTPEEEGTALNSRQRGLSRGNISFTWESSEQTGTDCSNGSKRLSGVFVLTAGTAGEAAVVVEAPHSLAGLVGSIHCLVALHARSCNIKQRESDKSERDTLLYT